MMEGKEIISQDYFKEYKASRLGKSKIFPNKESKNRVSKEKINELNMLHNNLYRDH